MKKIAGYILIVLAILMIYLSVKLGALPPGITGLGFIAIGVVFLQKE